MGGMKLKKVGTVGRFQSPLVSYHGKRLVRRPRIDKGKVTGRQR